MKRGWEVPRAIGFSLTAEQRDLMYRRTRPFLDHSGLGTPLTTLLQEAYLQGLQDAAAALASQRLDPNEPHR